MRNFASIKSRPVGMLSNRQSIKSTQNTELLPKKKRSIIQDSINEEEHYQSDDTFCEDDTSSTHSSRKSTIGGANVLLRLLLSGKRQLQQQQKQYSTTHKSTSTRGFTEFFQTARSMSTDIKKKQQTANTLHVTRVE